MDKKLQSIKNRIQSIEQIFVGTLLKKFKPCGKANCRCSEEEKYWHGPYYVWTRKDKGKTITKTLNKKQAEFLKKGIKYQKTVNQIIEKWRKESINLLNNL